MQPAEQLTRRFLERHPEAAADILASLSPEDAATVVGGLDVPAAIALFLRLPVLAAARCLERLPPEQAVAILAGMPLREGVDVLNRVHARERDRYLDVLPARQARTLRLGLGRLRDSVAALMDTQAAAYPADTLVLRVLEEMDRHHTDQGCQVYVADGKGRFAGVLSLRSLFVAHPHSRLGSLPLAPITALPASARSAGLAGHPAWLRHTCLPVVDAEGRLVGVLRRERLSELPRQAPRDGGGPLGMVQAFVESYAAGSALLLELLMKGVDRRG